MKRLLDWLFLRDYDEAIRTAHCLGFMDEDDLRRLSLAGDAALADLRKRLRA